MFEWLAGSTWGVPVLGAVHVLGIAWFGGMVLIEDPRLRRWRWAGLALMLVTGALLAAANPERTWASWAFRGKLVMLVLACMVRVRWVALVLWAGVIAASRGIAFF